MELVATIGTELFASSAATAGATAMTAGEAAFMSAAGAGAAGAAGAGAGSLFSLSTLGTGLSLASMTSSLFGGVQQGKAQAEALTQQAQEDMMSAKQAEIQGQQQANDIKDNLLQTIAQQRLAFAGAGIDPSFGTPVSLADESRRIAEMQLSTTRDNTQMTVAARRRQGAIRLGQRDSVRSAGLMQGVSSAGATLGDLIDRRTLRG